MLDFEKVIDALNKEKWQVASNLVSQEWLEYSEKDDPVMADSVSSLTDKLITVSQKLWWTQEKLYIIRKQSPEEFENQWKGNLSELHTLLNRATNLNVQRSRLMDEIDRKIAEMVKGNINPDDLVNPQHKTY